MIADTIDHHTLSQLVEAGAVSDAHVIGQDGGWAIVVHYGKAERTLTAQRNRQIRLFKRMETLVTYLKGVGISRFDVDAAAYAVNTYSRPDRAVAMRQTHEAAAHDKWFREQVREAIIEAADPNTVWVSSEDAQASWAKIRADLAARIAAGGKA